VVRRGQVTVRLTPDEVSLLEQALDALEADDLFTQRVQPSTSEQAIQAVTRVQAVSMLREILREAR
jgi:hypothetical protein